VQKLRWGETRQSRCRGRRETDETNEIEFVNNEVEDLGDNPRRTRRDTVMNTLPPRSKALSESAFVVLLVELDSETPKPFEVLFGQAVDEESEESEGVSRCQRERFEEERKERRHTRR
jgi:hypothetical protein